MKKPIVYLVFSLTVSVVLLFQCQEDQLVGDPARGESLAVQRCVGCHLLPEPEDLPKATWETAVLPRMGYMLGVYDELMPRDSLIEAGPARAKILAANIYPEQAQIEVQDWADIQAYYLENAPTSLAAPSAPNISTAGLPGFEVKIPDFRLSPPSITMTKIRSYGGFFIGDANTQSMYQFDADFQGGATARTREGAVHLEEFANTYVVTVMGSFSPTDAPSGMLFGLPKDGTSQPSILVNNLQRPVHTATADFNGDQLPDFVVSEFAKWTGKLALWSAQNGQYVPQVIKNQTGAIKSVVLDLNQDQRWDIVTLFGQAAEGIYAFIQQEDGSFREEKWLEFPASYGSSYFELLDMDLDGDLDILYTNGDNADYTPILKPYHGIRYFENNGQNEFEESFFYPLHGAYKAKPADYDGDGDLDIAAISFFPDFENHIEEGFVYLENDGANNYTAYSFPDVGEGRWITMDAGDIDQDGDLDILIGSLAFEVIPDGGLVEKWTNSGVPFIILENQLNE